jgi:uncharacterized protein (DUF1697 family)
VTTHVALLRAINVAGHNKVSMAELRGLLAELGFANVQSLLQSGNLVFDSRAGTPARLENLLEQAAKDRLQLETAFFVRSAKEWAEMVAGNPFPDEAKRDPGHLVVMSLKGAPDRGQVTALEKAIVGREVIRAGGRHLYIVYPDGIGRSKLGNALIEQKLGTQGTARNWNTVFKLASLVASSSP